jgi:hypothetical protein
MGKNTACYVFHASSAHTGAIDSESLCHIDHRDWPPQLPPNLNGNAT